jgi:hypothetical protein
MPDPLLLAYVGPETLLPLASILAAVGGALLFAWRWVAGFFRRCWHFILRREHDPRSESGPKSPASTDPMPIPSLKPRTSKESATPGRGE